MSEFSVGDRVGVVEANSGIFQGYAQLYMREEGEVVETDYGPHTDAEIKVEFDNNGVWLNSNDCELTSKGGQNEMENLEAIAVVGDDDLKEKLIEIAEDNGWDGSSTDTTNIFFKSPVAHASAKDIKHTKRDFRDGVSHADITSRVDEENREVLELPQDWEKAKKFVTQGFKKSLELAGEEVEVDGKEFTIGCYTGHLDDLQNLVDGLHGLGVNNVEITEQGRSVDIDDLIDLREFVEGQQ